MDTSTPEPGEIIDSVPTEDKPVPRNQDESSTASHDEKSKGGPADSETTLALKAVESKHLPPQERDVSMEGNIKALESGKPTPMEVDVPPQASTQLEHGSTSERIDEPGGDAVRMDSKTNGIYVI